MRPATATAVALLVAVFFAVSVGACGKTRLSEGGETWHAFREIEYRAPKAAMHGEQDGVLPGPGGLGGVPAGERPSVGVSVQGPHGFQLEIFREPGLKTLASERGWLLSQSETTNLVEKVTPNGWELTYDSVVYGTPTGKFHVHYAVLAGRQFTCRFSDAGSKDVAAAEAVCRSMRAKTTLQVPP